MTKSSRQLVSAIGLTLCVPLSSSASEPLRRMDKRVLEDKIRGGWAGQVIGVSFGAPTEFQWLGRIIEKELDWSPESVAGALKQDDLYVEMTFAEVMDSVGLEATTEQYGAMFRDSEYQLWHANAAARRNLQRGIQAPWSGHPKHNAHSNDIDFQIEADFIGLMAPGLPASANVYADRVGRVMNYGDGLYGGMFVAGMYAAAFFENDPRKVVEQGLLSIPPESGYAKVIGDVLTWSTRHPGDWKQTWQLIQEEWDRNDACPEGALLPFNIDARLNGAYITLGLLYGEGDFARTVEIATRAGQDSDCNPSNAAGILGVMLGYEGIPEEWRAGIPAMADEKFDYTQYSFNEIVDSTVRRAGLLIEQAGGEVLPDAVLVPVQKAQAPSLEQWDPGRVVKRADLEDPDWSWKGGWQIEKVSNDWAEWPTMTAGGPGDVVEFSFDGTGVSVVGYCSQAGGRADVFVDGEKAGMIDAWIPERTTDNDYWHIHDLEPGRHTVRIVVRDDKDERSTGNSVRLEAWVAFEGQ